MTARTMGAAAAALVMMAGAAWAQTNASGSSEPIKPMPSQGATGTPAMGELAGGSGAGAGTGSGMAAKTGEFGGTGTPGTPATGGAPRGTIPAAPADGAKP